MAVAAREMELGLSSLDVRAMREADSVAFDHPGAIRCTKRLEKPSPWQTEAEYAVPVYDSRIDTYGTRTYSYAFYMIHHANGEHDGVIWQTIVKLVRPGDHIALRWIADNCSQWMDAKGIVQDELRLHIWRNGRRVYSFNVATRVTDPYNMSRMVR